jgi:hypothetical protein
MPTAGGTLVEKWTHKWFGRRDRVTWVDQGENSLTYMEHATRVYEALHTGGLAYLGVESV